jgi:putative oxidoreductase
VKILKVLQPLGLLLLRITLAIIFVYHGYPKLARANPAMQNVFMQHGLPGYFVWLAGIIETFGGGLLLMGLFTSPAALLLAIEMGVAIAKVHSGHGAMAVHDYEFPLALGVACFALATIGAGPISLDHPLFEKGGGKPGSRSAKR